MTEPDYDAWLARLMDGTASREDYAIFDIRHKDQLARRVKDPVPRLLELGRSSDKTERSCAWSLMRYLIPYREAICEHLRCAWIRADLSDDERNALLWRVLDDPHLPLSYHKTIWNWVRSNKNVFTEALREYLQPKITEGKSYNECMRWSLNPEKHPRTKQWIYVAAAVLGACGSDEKREAAELLNKGALELQGTFFDELSDELRQLLGEYHETESRET